MKQLFRLALKYVTRQKLRTSLMFLSVTLSVFVLNTFVVYTSSIIRSLRNEAAYEYGEWEVNISDVLLACEYDNSSKELTKEEAAQIVVNHVAVDKAFAKILYYFQFPLQPDDEGNIGFFNVELDNGSRQRNSYAIQSCSVGDPSILSYRADFAMGNTDLAPDEAIVPYWFSEAGYGIGDTVTVTITPEMGQIDEDSEVIKEVRSVIAKLNEESEDFYYIIEGDEIDQEERGDRQLQKKDLMTLINKYSDLNELELKNSFKGEPVTATMKIAGFDSSRHIETRSMAISVSLNSTVDITALEDSALEFNKSWSSNCYVRTNQNTSLEYNMELLLKELGFEDENAYDDFKNEMNGYGITFNTEYLLTSFRSIEGIATVVPAILVYAVLLVIVWFFARFIIDNAFEISVQERSVQFAALRVMGASKVQLATLVFTEGLFYSLTALPLGAVASTLACKYVFDSLHKVGVDFFEFYAPPLTILICVVLCLAGVFISTYTSAMWASRKLSPAEALNYGKPKSKRTGKRHRRSKLKLTSRRFMLRYTTKNIMRTKRRFFISSVAMALGVMMFTLCLQLGITLFGEVREELLSRNTFDFYIYTDADKLQEMHEKLSNSGNFRDYHYNLNGGARFMAADVEKLSDYEDILKNYHQNDVVNMSVMAMDKNEFESRSWKWLDDMNIPEEQQEEKSYSQLLGMSYEEFENSGKAVLFLPQKWYDTSPDFGYGYTPLTDTVTLTSEEGFSYEIQGVANVSQGVQLIVPMSLAYQLMNTGSYMSANYYINVLDAEHYEAAKADIDSLSVSSDAAVPDNVYNQYSTGTGLKYFVKTIVTIVLIFMLSIWLCGIVSMMNTINTSALNRSKELLMMRAVGMTRKQLTGTVVLESLLFSSVSAIAGTLISVLGYQLIMRFIFEYEDAGSSIIALLISIIANVIIALLASLPGIRTINHSVSK